MRADGTLDPAWQTRPNRIVGALAVSGGTVYAGGEFTRVDGLIRNRLVALDAITGAVTDWNPNAVGRRDAFVGTVVVADGTVYVAGSFTRVGGKARRRLAALDAETARATAWRPRPNGIVVALAVSGGTVYVGGAFTRVGEKRRHGIAALDARTGRPTGWSPGLAGNYGSPWVSSLAVSVSTVFVGGEFDRIGGKVRRNLAALDARTGRATAWNPDANYAVLDLAVSGRTVYAAGAFTEVSGQTRLHLAAVETSGGRVTDWAPAADAYASVLAASDEKVYVGGEFTSIGGAARSNLAAIDVATGRATAWNPGPDGSVETIAVSGSTVYVGGWFDRVGGRVRHGLAAIDTTTGSVAAWDPNPVGEFVYLDALAVTGATVYVGGQFSRVGGQARNNLAAVDATTGRATGWNPDSDGEVLALAVSGSVVYVGGDFTRVGGQHRNRLAALDAATGGATAWNPDVGGQGGYEPVKALAVSGSTVYIGGSFERVGTKARYNLAAIDATTGAVTPWDPGTNGIFRVDALVLSGSTVYVGGLFTRVGGQDRNNLAAIDATSGAVTAWNPAVIGGGVGIAGPVLTLAGVRALAVAGRTLFVGADFEPELQSPGFRAIDVISGELATPGSVTAGRLRR